MTHKEESGTGAKINKRQQETQMELYTENVIRKMDKKKANAILLRTGGYDNQQTADILGVTPTQANFFYNSGLRQFGVIWYNMRYPAMYASPSGIIALLDIHAGDIREEYLSALKELM